jgi:SulP family sulfate permease
MPTLWMSLLSIGVMYGLKKHLPKIPNVLAAVALTTGLSYYTNFQAAGGHVVGDIPSGLPSFALPAFDGDIMLQLIAAAITISLLGFVETIAIAKKMAAQTRQRLDANQELIGQGLSNMVSGSFSAYPVSGSLSRSAINLKAGAVSGFSSVVSGIVIGAGLLWLTPLLYHLPQATLAAIVIMAAIDLIKIKAILHAWRAQPHDGVAALAAFVLTLALAPRLDQGLIIGVLLSIGLFLYRSMRPRMAVLSRYHDGALRDISVHHLPSSEKIAVLRFDDSLHFANAGYFEAKVLDVAAINPELRFILIDANGIAEIDATGEDALFHLVQRLKANGVELLLARMNEQCMGALRRTQASDKIGEDHFFSHVEHALSFAWDQLGTDYDRESCPLRHPHQ